MRWLVLSLLLFAGCIIGRKAEEKRVKKEQEYIQQLSAKYAGEKEPYFIQVPGGMISLKNTIPCPDFDNGEVSSKGGHLNIKQPCPPVSINADSIIENSDRFKQLILKLQGSQLSGKLSADSVVYLNRSVDALEKQNKGLWKSVLWLGGISLILTAWTFRSPIISIVKKILV